MKRKQMMQFALLCLVLPMSLVLPLFAQQAVDAPEIGDSAPTWTELPATDDKKYSLASFRDLDVVVLCFTCNSCPYASDYEDRMVALQKKFVETGLSAQLVAINSNTVPADRMDRMKARAGEKGINYPYLWDESQSVARAYGAIYTPEFYVLNKQRKIIYRGALDNATLPDKVTVKYVELAVAAALSGTKPAVEKAGARGCGIRFNRKRR